jgi:hypothetical protein
MQEHRKQETVIARELGASRLTSTSGDSDTEMDNVGGDSDSDYVLVDESEELRHLKQKKLQLESQLNAAATTVDTPEDIDLKQVVAKGPEALKQNYTVSLSQGFRKLTPLM